MSYIQSRSFGYRLSDLEGKPNAHVVLGVMPSPGLISELRTSARSIWYYLVEMFLGCSSLQRWSPGRQVRIVGAVACEREADAEDEAWESGWAEPKQRGGQT